MKTKSGAIGIRWAYLSNAVSYITQPIVLILLARVLTPSDFGLIAMALVVITFFDLFRDMGLSQALIYQRGATQELASTAFWTQFLLCITIFGLIWAIAPLISVYYRDARLVPILRAMAGIFLLSPLIDIPYALLLRALHFKALFVRQGVPTLVGGVVSIALGWTGFGVWSLVIGQLVGRGIAGAISLWVSRWVPAFEIKAGLIRSLLRFGGQVSLQKVLGWIIVWIDRWFVGRFLGAASVGIYHVGMRLGEVPYLASGSPMALVAYPVMVRDNQDGLEIRHRYLSYLRGIALIGLPLGISMVLVMPFAVPGILGPQWAQSTEVFQVILLGQTLACFVSLNPEVFKALGRPDIMSRFFLVRAAISVPVYFLAARENILTLAFAHLLLVILFAPINMYITMRIADIKFKQILSSIRSGMVVATALIPIGLLYWWQGPQVIYADIINTALLIILLLGTGTVILRMVDLEAFHQMKKIMMPTLPVKRE